jgi:uncharacterized membrane protein YqjE
MSTLGTQRSVPELLQGIVGNLEEIVRAELRLAKAEVKEDAAQAATPVAALGVGLVIALFGVGFLLLAAVYALSLVIASWLAALIVGAALSVAAAITISSSITRLKRLNLTPDKTFGNVEENVQWAKDRIKSNGKSRQPEMN